MDFFYAPVLIYSFFFVYLPQGDSSSLHSCQLQKLCLGLYGTRQQIGRKRIRGQEDDFEVEDAVDYEMDGQTEDDDDEGDLRDYETEYDMPMGDYLVQESETFMSTEGGEEERIVDYKIDEEEFHKLSLYDCDFFIRKVPDQDDDVFDFREVLQSEVLIFLPSPNLPIGLLYLFKERVPCAHIQTGSFLLIRFGNLDGLFSCVRLNFSVCS